MDRKIVLDTETTGLYPSKGDKIIEIGCVEIVNGIKTGSSFQVYVNPQRDVPEEAFNVHGISAEFLKNKPIFSKIAPLFLEYIGTSILVIHNANFDISFLNYELTILGYSEIRMSRVIDTLKMARKKYPGSPASLNALCKKFNISLKDRNKHGALLDADLLASVYIQMIGGDQSNLNLVYDSSQDEKNFNFNNKEYEKRIFSLSEDDVILHKNMLKKLKGNIW